VHGALLSWEKSLKILRKSTIKVGQEPLERKEPLFHSAVKKQVTLWSGFSAARSRGNSWRGGKFKDLFH